MKISYKLIFYLIFQTNNPNIFWKQKGIVLLIILKKLKNYFIMINKNKFMSFKIVWLQISVRKNILCLNREICTVLESVLTSQKNVNL